MYETVATPESRKLARDPLFKLSAKLDLNKPNQPLLFIAGSNDNIFPPEFSKKIANAYKDKTALLVSRNLKEEVILSVVKKAGKK